MANYNEKYFGGEPPKEYNMEKLISANEQILWRGKPNRKAHILAQVFKMMPLALIWLLFDGAFIGLMVNFDVFSQMPPVFTVFIVIFFAFHLIPVWIWIANIVTAGRRQKNMEYVFTNTRIIIKSGVIGIDVTNVYYADISNVNLRVGLIDRWLHVGDVYISGAFKAQVLWDIENPYEVTTKLQKIVNDIKTDTYYPNELRPDTNSGFDTRYTGRP